MGRAHRCKLEALICVSHVTNSDVEVLVSIVQGLNAIRSLLMLDEPVTCGGQL